MTLFKNFGRLYENPSLDTNRKHQSFNYIGTRDNGFISKRTTKT